VNGRSMTTSEAPVTTGTASVASAPVTSKRSYGPIVITLENVLIPPDKLTPSPSAIDGLDDETETFLRIGGSELIQTSGILLKLPQTAMATGQVLFQRFYYSKSFVRQPMEVTAMACIYLASKIEEAPRRIRDVINVFHHIRQIRAGKIIQPLILDPSYVRLKNDVTLAERRVLKELGFCVHVKHPHKIIVIYLQQLGYNNDKDFVQMSWNYMNDALRTNVFVKFTPEAIACACIFLSARKLRIPLPSGSNWYWYNVFDVSEADVVEIASTTVALYHRAAINYEELEKKVDVLAKAYLELREKGKSAILSGKNDEKPSSSNETPESRQTSPSRIPEIVVTSASKSFGGGRDHHESNKRHAADRLNGDADSRKSHRDRDRDRDLSPAKRMRRSPSPIIFNNNSTYHHRQRSPTRHKHKKRKKSKYSSSRSRSRSRSPRDRRSSKKGYRNRSRSPGYKDYHHKKSYSSAQDRRKPQKERNYS